MEFFSKKPIIVEFNARRQKLIVNNHLISLSKLLKLILHCFDLQFEQISLYRLQMYNYTLNKYETIDDLNKDIQYLHRFRLQKINPDFSVKDSVFLFWEIFH